MDEDAAARRRRIQAERRRNRMKNNSEDRLGLITGDRRAPGLDIKEVEQPTEEDLKKLEKLARPIAGISSTNSTNTVVTGQNTGNNSNIPNPLFQGYQQSPPQATPNNTTPAYAIPPTLIFVVIFGTVWISFILQCDP